MLRAFLRFSGFIAVLHLREFEIPTFQIPRESAAAASHAAVLAQPKKIRGGTEPTKLVEYRLHFCGAKAPLFLNFMQKT